MKIPTLSVGTALATVSLLGTLVPAQFASASTKGKKNTAIGLGAAAAYELLNHKGTNGLLLGAGAAYAYKQYKESQANEKRRQRAASYRTTHTYHSRYGGSSTHSYPRSVSRNVFTGRIDKDTDYIHRRLFVTTNGVDRRVETPKDIPIYQAGQRVSVHDLRRGDVLRVRGYRTSNGDWRATRIDVVKMAGVDVGSNPYVVNPSHRYDRYNDATGLTVSHYSGVGLVRSIDRDDQSFVIEAGNHIRTIFSRDTQFDGVEGVSDLRPGDRVRISGDMDGADVDASHVTLVQ